MPAEADVTGADGMTPGSRWPAWLRRPPVGRFSTEGAAGEVLRIAWSRRPGLAAALFMATVLSGISGPLRYVALGTVVAAITTGADLLPPLAFLAAVSLVNGTAPLLMGVLADELSRQVDLALSRRLMAVAAEPPGIAHLEDPEQRDLLALARGVAGGDGPGSVVSGYANLLALKLGGLCAVLLLAQYRWWLGLGVALGAAVIRRFILRVWFETAEALAGDLTGLRRARYLRDLVLRPAAAKEQRVFGLSGWLAERHGGTWSKAMLPVWARRRRNGIRMLAVDLVVLVLAGLAVVPIVGGLLSGELDSARAVVLGGSLSAIVALGGFLPDADFPIYYGCLALPPLRRLEEEVRTGPRTADREGALPPGSPAPRIRFEGVSFTYPGTSAPVLRGLDLTVEAGTSVALVGVNGSGKTTIVKLLAGLHQPVAGRITVAGTDLREMAADEWRRRLAVAFQDFARFELTARDNIGFGALERIDDIEALEDAARRAGVLDIVRGLPRGWDSPLARGFTGGAELSGGEWQRIALARLLFARAAGAQVLVLDEPTASLDVRAEAAFNDRFVDLTRGATTLLISHRVTTVRRADRICVLDGGRLVEDGTHDELLALDGRYARMARLQAERFADA